MNLNKKAQTGNALFGIITFLILLIIFGVGLAAGIYMFFGQDYDFRQIDAELLNAKISSCLKVNQLAFQEKTTAPTDEFYEKCDLNKNVIEENFALLITLNEKEKLRWKDIALCALNEKNKNFPVCESSEFTTSQGTFKIITGANQQIKRGVT